MRLSFSICHNVSFFNSQCQPTIFNAITNVNEFSVCLRRNFSLSYYLPFACRRRPRPRVTLKFCFHDTELAWKIFGEHKLPMKLFFQLSLFRFACSSEIFFPAFHIVIVLIYMLNYILSIIKIKNINYSLRIVKRTEN